MEISSYFKATLYFYSVTAKNLLLFLKPTIYHSKKVDMEWRKIIFEKLRLCDEGEWQFFTVKSLTVDFKNLIYFF